MGFAGTYIDADTEALRVKIRRLDQLSKLLDVAFVVPGTRIRFGIDAIVGLIPVVGDWAGVVLSSIIVIEAARIGVSRMLLARMIANVVIEGGIGIVPMAGDIFDVFWRANRRNIALLKKYLERDGRL